MAETMTLRSLTEPTEHAEKNKKFCVLPPGAGPVGRGMWALRYNKKLFTVKQISDGRN